METPPNSSNLHHSQKVFWYVTSFSIIALTCGFLFALFTGKATSIKAAMFEMTLKEAVQTVTVSAMDMSEVRNALFRAHNSDDETAFKEAMSDFDKALEKLGVAQEALEKVKLQAWDSDWGSTKEYSGGYGGGSFYKIEPEK